MNTIELKEIYLDGRLLNIAAYSNGTRALGPGLRAAVWVQGCPRHCAGCIAPDWLALKPKQMIAPQDLVSLLTVEQIDGLTISGGDPMLQAAGLSEMVRLLREERDLNIICYTGYLYEELLELQDPAVSSLLSMLDVLIDGPYIEALNDDRGIRGSSNQKVIHLTDRLKDYDFHTQKRSLEINVLQGELFSIGVPEKRMKRALEVFSENIRKHKQQNKAAQKPRIKISTKR